MRDGQGENGRVETGIEVGATSHANDADPNDAAAAPASVDTGFDTTSVTVTVNPAQAPAPANVETGFADLDGTPAPVQQAAPTVNSVADTGERENPDADLDARVAALLPNRSITNWNAVSAFMGAVVPWPGSPQDPGWVNMHYSFPSRDDPKVLVKKGGWPKKTITDFIGSVAFALKSPTRTRTSGTARRCSRRPRATPTASCERTA